MKLTAEQRIERAHVKLMQSKEFCLFSGVFMVGKVEVSDRVITACTNGRDVTYGRQFVDSLTEKQLAFLVVHEAMHKAYRHLTVWKHLPNKKLANFAMDFVINLQIVASDPHESEVSMPRDADGNLMGCLDEQYLGMDTKQVYDLLEEKGKGGNESSDDGGENGHGGGQNGNESSSPNGELDEHDWNGAREMTDKDKEELEREIDGALREGSILARKMKGNVPRGIDELLHPKVDWKEALREFIKVATKGNDQSTWRRPNRRFIASGIIMPSTESHKAKCIAIGDDTSGSVSGELHAQFLGEIDLICKDVNPECIELLYWGSKVVKHETYKDSEVENLIASTKPRGGGGTEPECVPKYIMEKSIAPQCVVMLTDGYFADNDGHDEWVKLGVPVLWCVIGNTGFTPSYGQVVSISS